jgi:phosphocarrier protein HPr
MLTLPSCSTNATIVNRLGLHARPAMAFVDAATQFSSKITVANAGNSVDAKSIMQVMMLAATKGTELEITAEGDDADKACDTLRALIESGFDED